MTDCNTDRSCQKFGLNQDDHVNYQYLISEAGNDDDQVPRATHDHDGDVEDQQDGVGVTVSSLCSPCILDMGGKLKVALVCVQVQTGKKSTMNDTKVLYSKF